MLKRNQIIDNFRGICMLGVIAIHVGSFVLESQNPNVNIYMLLEILSRYSVPTFFFISGYGLFCQYKPTDNFAYLPFLKKRLQSVGIPYIMWSILYLLYFSIVMPGCISWQAGNLFFLLFFGLACYHLYFMVILLWFYFLFPLWHKLLFFFNQWGLKRSFIILFILQFLFNYWTCHPGFTATEWPSLFKNLFDYRLNYLPLHYLFVFMLGGLWSTHSQSINNRLQEHYSFIITFYCASIIFIAGSYYYAYYHWQYSLITLVNTFQQLSLQGLLYTLASILFFSATFNKISSKNIFMILIERLSVNSLLIYLIHPFWMDIIHRLCNKFNIVITDKRILLIYVLLIILSLLSSEFITKLRRYLPSLVFLLTGRYYDNQKSKKA